MLKTFIIILPIILVIHYLRYKKYINPYKLYMIFGKKGSGKSTYLVKLALDYQKKGYNIYTNMTDMMIPNIRIINEDDLGEYVPEEKSVILWDEAGLKFDNRQYKQFKTEVRDFFKLQRHYKCIVYLASQSFDVDIKLRSLTDKMYLVSNFGIVYTLVRPISKTITLTESTSEKESRIAENLKFNFIFSWKIFKTTKYQKYFDSFIVPKKPKLKYITPQKAVERTTAQYRPRIFNKSERAKATERPKERNKGKLNILSAKRKETSEENVTITETEVK